MKDLNLDLYKLFLGLGCSSRFVYIKFYTLLYLNKFTTLLGVLIYMKNIARDTSS